MNEFKNILIAFRQAFNLFSKGKLLYFFIPGIFISLLFFLFYSGVQATSGFLDFLEKTPWIGSYLVVAKNTAFGWTVGIGAFLYQFIILTLFSPFNTILSERVDTELTGRKFPFGWGKFIRDFFRLLGIVIVGAVFYGIFYLVWIFIAKITGIQLLTPLVFFVLTSFFTGFNSYDYSLERNNIPVSTSWKYAFHNPLQMIFAGAIYSGIIFIPVIGLIIAPVLSTLIATCVYIKKGDRIGYR